MKVPKDEKQQIEYTLDINVLERIKNAEPLFYKPIGTIRPISLKININEVCVNYEKIIKFETDSPNKMLLLL